MTDFICPAEIKAYSIRYDIKYKVYSDSVPKINPYLIHDLDSVFDFKSEIILVDTVQWMINRIEDGKTVRAIGKGGSGGWSMDYRPGYGYLCGVMSVNKIASQICEYSGFPIVPEFPDDSIKYQLDTLIIPEKLPVDDLIDSLGKQGVFIAKGRRQCEYVKIVSNTCPSAIEDGLFRYSPRQMKADADFFFSTVEKYHVKPYFLHGKSAYKQKKKEIYARLQTCLTKKDFYKTLASINSFLDPHTQIYSTYRIDEIKKLKNTGEKIFPDIIYREKKYFTVIDGKEKEISSINGMQISVLNDSINSFISDVSPNMRKLIIENSFSLLLPVFYNIHPPYTVETEGQSEVWTGISIDSSRAYQNEFRDIKAYSYSVYPKSSIAIFYFNTLQAGAFDMPKFDLKMKELSDSLKVYNINNLFIDVSKNSGGSLELLPLLFSYFQHERVFFHPRIIYREIPPITSAAVPNLSVISEPVKNDSLFNGKLWILQGTRSYSGGDIICRIMKQNRLGVRIGQKTSQPGKTYIPCVSRRLPYSSLDFNCAFGYWEFQGGGTEFLEPDMFWDVDDTFDFSETELAAMLDAWQKESRETGE